MSTKIYAFPSISKPQVLLTSKLFKEDMQLAGSILRGLDLRLEKPHVTQALSIDELTEQGVIENYLAAFLLPIDKQKELDFDIQEAIKNGELAWLCSDQRKNEVRTVFRKAATGLCVDKFFMNTKADVIETENFSFHACKNTPVFPGTLLNAKLEKLAQQKNWPEFNRLLNLYFRTLFKRFSFDPSSPDNNLLTGNTIDMITRNCMISRKEEFYFFDQEYFSSKPIPKSFIIYRSCYGLMKPNNMLFYESPFHSIQSAYRFFCREQNVPEDLDGDLYLEAWFIGNVMAKKKRPVRIDTITKPFSPLTMQQLKHQKNVNKYQKKLQRSLLVNFILMVLLIILAVKLIFFSG